MKPDTATGDLLGDELLLVRTTLGVLALYTLYGGAPFGPLPADSLKMHADTVTGRVAWGTEFSEPESKTWLLDRGEQSDSSDLRRLHRQQSLREFLDPNNSRQCPATRANDRIGF